MNHEARTMNREQKLERLFIAAAFEPRQSTRNESKRIVAALTPKQRFDVAWADDNETIHGVKATPEIKSIAYWWDCNE